jgi:alpha-glucosidase
MWASGQDGVYDDGRGRGGLSGVHPFLLVQTKNPRRYFGMFFRNSNAMTPVLRYNADGTSVLSFITIGGQLEMYFFGQGTAHEVIQMYQAFVSLPKLPPFWALGWQEASPNPSTGGNDQAAVAQALTNYKQNGLPLEAVYLQSDSWDQTNDFTLDTGKFPKINDLAATIKAGGQRLVAYVDAAVNVKDRAANRAYIAGKNVDGFIKSTINEKNPDGYLLNTKSGKTVVYVDWLNSQSADYWGNQVKSYQNNVPYDGLWTTMNEPFGDAAGEMQASTESPQREL